MRKLQFIGFIFLLSLGLQSCFVQNSYKFTRAQAFVPNEADSAVKTITYFGNEVQGQIQTKNNVIFGASVNCSGGNRINFGSSKFFSITSELGAGKLIQLKNKGYLQLYGGTVFKTYDYFYRDWFWDFGSVRSDGNLITNALFFQPAYTVLNSGMFLTFGGRFSGVYITQFNAPVQSASNQLQIDENERVLKFNRIETGQTYYFAEPYLQIGYTASRMGVFGYASSPVLLNKTLFPNESLKIGLGFQISF